SPRGVSAVVVAIGEPAGDHRDPVSAGEVAEGLVEFQRDNAGGAEDERQHHSAHTLRAGEQVGRFGEQAGVGGAAQGGVGGGNRHGEDRTAFDGEFFQDSLRLHVEHAPDENVLAPPGDDGDEDIGDHIVEAVVAGGYGIDLGE